MVILCFNPLFLDHFYSIALALASPTDSITIITDVRLRHMVRAESMSRATLYETEPEIRGDLVIRQLEILSILTRSNPTLILTLSTNQSFEVLMIDRLNAKTICINPHPGDAINGHFDCSDNIPLSENRLVFNYALALVGSALRIILPRWRWNEFVVSVFQNLSFTTDRVELTRKLFPLFNRIGIRYPNKITQRYSLFFGYPPDIYIAFCQPDVDLYKKWSSNPRFYSIWSAVDTVPIVESNPYDVVISMPAIVLSSMDEERLLEVIEILGKIIELRAVFIRPYPFYGSDLNKNEIQNINNFYLDRSEKFGWTFGDRDAMNDKIFICSSNSSVVRHFYGQSPIIALDRWPSHQYARVGNRRPLPGVYYLSESAQLRREMF